MWTSDCFEGPIFVDSLKKVIIPHWKNTDGVKCLIGDSLASHPSMEVLELCEKYSIRFCFLPPSSTHLLQPLDVSLPVSKRLCFQLSLALEGITDISANILSGHRECGIIPLSRDGPCHNSLAQLMHLHQGARWMPRNRNRF